MPESGNDLRYGARLLLKNRFFTVVAVLSLALGIGANSAIFQLLDAVRLRTLPVKNPEQLASIQIASGSRGGKFNSRHADFTSAIWEQLHTQQQAFSEIAAWSPQSLNLGQGGEAHYAEAPFVSGSFFGVLGIEPERGRLLAQADDVRGCGAQAAVISYGFWQHQFGGTADILGKKLSIHRAPRR